MNNSILYYFLKAQTKYFHEIATGTTIKYISRDKFEELFFPLPPLSEQQRIVSKIEEIFAILDRISSELGADI
ncbi:MAG: restriction endonuclease subunit S [Campylobacter sp.]|nr:restriction endonuclease subunit S [Campylobacter sp.]